MGLAVVAVPLGAGPAEAAACSGSSGVTVVVDFGALGGIRTSCAAGDPSSGLAALHAAGFSTAGTTRDGPAFVCRISGLPTPAQDPCVRTPPTTAYWAYFHASPGGPWAYSPGGAASYDPAPGSVEGWRYGGGAAPGIAPPTAPAPPPPKPTTKQPSPAPAPTTRSSAPGAGNPAPGIPGSPGDPGTPGAAAPGRTSGPGATGRPAATSGAATSGTVRPSATTPGATLDPAAPGPTTDPAATGPGQPVTEPASSSRGLAGSLIGAAVVAAVGTAAFLVVRRRRTGAA